MEPSQEHSQKTSSKEEFQGFHCGPKIIPNIISFQTHFQAHDDDVVVASKPKAGTTWLKALAFAVANRNRCSLSQSFNTSNPHDLVPYFETTLYAGTHLPDLSAIPSPRLFSTHLPYKALAESIKSSNGKILYVARNPFDVMVSLFHFNRRGGFGVQTLEECLEIFCNGVEGFGPFWDHVLGYWNQSLENPNKVLFLKYEEMKEDPVAHTRKLAEFIGCPFTEEEEKQEVVEEIVKLCCLGNLKEQEVNKNGKHIAWTAKNEIFFRKGEVGDYVNHFSPSQVDRFKGILNEKLQGSGLTFKM